MGNVKVELRQIGQTLDERNSALRGMMAAFRRKVNEAGIMAALKERQYYESKGEKRRRKAKERVQEARKEQFLAKSKFKENFNDGEKVDKTAQNY